MSTIVKPSVLVGLFALAISTASGAAAQNVVEQSAEYRFQLDFRVSDAALQQMLPQGWEPAIAEVGPAKDANLRMIFIDRVGIVDADGRPSGNGSERLVYLAIPVKETAGDAGGQMIIVGLTEDAANVPGPFGIYQHARTTKMVRSTSMSGGAILVEEDWGFAAANGEHVQLHVKYERAPPRKGGRDTSFFNPSDPTKHLIFRTEQGIDIARNVTTNPPDRVMEFSYTAGGGRIAPLFDGTERVLSWDSFPWYNLTILEP